MKLLKLFFAAITLTSLCLGNPALLSGQCGLQESQCFAGASGAESACNQAASTSLTMALTYAWYERENCLYNSLDRDICEYYYYFMVETAYYQYDADSWQCHATWENAMAACSAAYDSCCIENPDECGLSPMNHD